MARGKRQRLAERRLAAAIADRLKAQPPPRSARQWRWTTKTIAFLVGLFTLGATAYQFRPLVTVLPEAPLDSREVVSSPFVVTNAGWLLPIYSVGWSCHFNGLETKKLGRTRQGHTTLEMKILPALTADDRMTAQCWRSVGIEPGDELIAADLSVFVDYFWLYWPWRLTKEARFATARAADGGLRWLPQPIPNRTEGGRLTVVPSRQW